MERSNYENFMDCYNEVETMYHLAITAAVGLEYIEKHRASGAPFTEAGEDEAVREIERRLALAKSEIYTSALVEWVERQLDSKSEQSEENADQ